MLELVGILTALGRAAPAAADLLAGDCSDEPAACEPAPARAPALGVGHDAGICLGDDTCQPDETPHEAPQTLTPSPALAAAPARPAREALHALLVRERDGDPAGGHARGPFRPPQA